MTAYPSDIRTALANVEAALDDLAGDIALLRERVETMMPAPKPTPQRPRLVNALAQFFRTKH